MLPPVDVLRAPVNSHKLLRGTRLLKEEADIRADRAAGTMNTAAATGAQ